MNATTIVQSNFVSKACKFMIENPDNEELLKMTMAVIGNLAIGNDREVLQGIVKQQAIETINKFSLPNSLSPPPNSRLESSGRMS